MSNSLGTLTDFNDHRLCTPANGEAGAEGTLKSTAWPVKLASIELLGQSAHRFVAPDSRAPSPASGGGLPQTSSILLVFGSPTPHTP